MNSKRLSDQDFVEFCYQQILGRKSDKAGRLDHLKALRSRRINTREELMIAFIASDEYQNNRRSREFFPTA